MGIVSDFRLQPPRVGTLFLFVVAVAVLVLGTPVVVGATLPERTRPAEQVILATDGLEYDVVVDDLYCPIDINSMSGSGWLCDEAAVDYTGYESIANPDLALRRAVRAHSVDAYLPEEDPQYSTDGTAAIYTDPQSQLVVMALGDPAGTTDGLYVVTIDGTLEQAATVADRLWRAATDEGLPADTRVALSQFPAGNPYSDEVAQA